MDTANQHAVKFFRITFSSISFRRWVSLDFDHCERTMFSQTATSGRIARMASFAVWGRWYTVVFGVGVGSVAILDLAALEKARVICVYP